MRNDGRQVTRRRGNKSERWKKIGLSLLVWSIGPVLFSLAFLFYVNWTEVSRMGNHLLSSFLQNPYFSVQEVRVAGGRRVGGSEIIALTGLRRGMKMWKIDPKVIEEKVSRHPWVRRVLVRREFPQRIVIKVEEWVAEGIVVLGRLYYVNAEGFIFKEVAEGEKVDLPLITGLRWGSIESHARSDRQRIAEALRLSDLIGKTSISISEIHFGNHRGVVIYPVTLPIALRMGWGDWPEKVHRLKHVLTKWRGKENRLALLDLSFSDQVVVRLREKVGLRGQQSVISQIRPRSNTDRL
jgi:hypothetical protein